MLDTRRASESLGRLMIPKVLLLSETWLFMNKNYEILKKNYAAPASEMF